MAASEALPYLKSIFNGLYDSVFGIIAFFKPIYRKEDTVHAVAASETEEVNASRTRRRPKPSTTATQKCQRLFNNIYYDL